MVENPKFPVEEERVDGFSDPFESEEESIADIPIGDHLDPDAIDQCGYCGQHFGPDEIVIEKTILGRLWRFCSEACLNDFRDASDFRDQDLDGDASDRSAEISGDTNQWNDPEE